MAEQLAITDGDGRRRIGLAGRWTMDRVDGLARAIGPAAAGAPAAVEIDAAGVENLDLTGAWLLHSLEGRLAKSGAAVTWRPARPQPLAFVDELLAGGGSAEPAPASRAPLVTRPLHRIGRFTVGLRHSALDHLSLLGGVVAALGRALSAAAGLDRPPRLRHRHHRDPDRLADRVPDQRDHRLHRRAAAAKFGADIFVVDLVTVGVLRELGVLLTAIIVAGRSGSAFAAEIGAMQLNEEVDALKATGVDPVDVLVLPRTIGLVIALPLLTVVADAIGLAGGAILCRWCCSTCRCSSSSSACRSRSPVHVLGRHHQGAGVRAADRRLGTLSRHAGARLLARARPPDDRRGRAVDLPGDPRRRAVRVLFMELDI
jgi:phospholipid/cholesterol/gamma-HCH transport system permease protein